MKITKICDCCGKEKTLHPSDYHSKVFFTCSKECQYIMQSQYGKRLWANLTPEKREEWINKINNNRNNGQGLINYWAEHNEKMLKHTVESIKNHDGGINVNDRVNMKLSRSPCVLLKAHAIIMKDDPEHLTTDFIQDLMGIKCKNHDENKTHLQ